MTSLLLLLCPACTVTWAQSSLPSEPPCHAEEKQRIEELETEIAEAQQQMRDVLEELTIAEEKANSWATLIITDDSRLENELDVVSIYRRDVNESGCTNMQDRSRLINGTSSSGRLEILLGDEWSTVRNSGFGRIHAGIVCAALGYNSARAHPLTHAMFGDGGNSLLADQYCKQSVGVNCRDSSPHPIRLANSSGLNRGRVEIQIAGQWGTICGAYSWKQSVATKVCQMLGINYPHGALAVSSYFGPGTGPVWLDSLSCTGGETDLLDCSTDQALPTGCSHHFDAGVICDDWLNFPVRLVNGSNAHEGRVEIQINGQWGTISNDGWDNADANVVCTMLGYHVNASSLAAKFGEGTGPVWLNNLYCTGHEDHILQCPSSYPLGFSGFSHANDVGVICSSDEGPVIEVRLVNGSIINGDDGRVEVRVNDNEWGTICDDRWDALDARVICRQLGKNTEHARAYSQSHFGQGSGPILLDEVDCRGDELNLDMCIFPGFGIHNCIHGEDAGVSCIFINLEVRIVNGSIINGDDGRVEVRVNGNEWGTVCDDNWDILDAQVVCRQLGKSVGHAKAYSNAHFGNGTGPILLDEVGCLGDETSLDLCIFVGVGIHDCSHAEDAGVSCT